MIQGVLASTLGQIAREQMDKKYAMADATAAQERMGLDRERLAFERAREARFADQAAYERSYREGQARSQRYRDRTARMQAETQSREADRRATELERTERERETRRTQEDSEALWERAVTAARAAVDEDVPSDDRSRLNKIALTAGGFANGWDEVVGVLNSRAGEIDWDDLLTAQPKSTQTLKGFDPYAKIETGGYRGPFRPGMEPQTMDYGADPGTFSPEELQLLNQLGAARRSGS